MDIPIVRLQESTAAIAAFWVDAEYIYNESVEPKHWSFEERFIKERATRAWLPQMPRLDPYARFLIRREQFRG
jgi:hypothetical protein